MPARLAAAETGVRSPDAEVSRARSALDDRDATMVELSSRLPTSIVDGLQTSSRGLRERVELLAVGVTRVAEALGGTASEDVSWVQQRLGSLDARERADGSQNAKERQSLQAAMDQAQAAARARQELEVRLTSHLAQFLEIAALARRTRHELLTAMLTETTASELLERLSAQVCNIAEVQRELELLAVP